MPKAQCQHIVPVPIHKYLVPRLPDLFNIERLGTGPRNDASIAQLRNSPKILPLGVLFGVPTIEPGDMATTLKVGYP